MKLLCKVRTIISLALCLCVSNILADEMPLMAAVQQGDIGSVRSLLRGKADVNSARADGTTALAWAAYKSDEQAVELLLRSGANPDAANDDLYQHG